MIVTKCLWARGLDEGGGNFDYLNDNQNSNNCHRHFCAVIHWPIRNCYPLRLTSKTLSNFPKNLLEDFLLFQSQYSLTVSQIASQAKLSPPRRRHSSACCSKNTENKTPISLLEKIGLGFCPCEVKSYARMLNKTFLRRNVIHTQ